MTRGPQKSSGYDFVSTSDHPSGTEPTYEVWTMLTWVAAATSRIKIATRVLGVPYRPPAMVAKMAESLHRLSGGRLILGLGGGYSDEEFRAFGLGVPTPREKVDGMVDAIHIMRGLWSQAELHIPGAATAPSRPPWSPSRTPPSRSGSARTATGRWRRPGSWRTAGSRRWGSHRRSRPPPCASGSSTPRRARPVRCVYNVPFQIGADSDSASVVAGSPQAVLDRLGSLAALGFTSMNFMPAGPDPRGQAERLALEVLPELRKLV